MHKVPLIILSTLFISSVALAGDMTATGTVQPHWGSVVNLTLPAGKSQVDVWDEDGKNISCTFFTKGGFPVAKDEVVKRCVAYANLDDATPIVVQIVNGNNTTVNYRAWVRNVK